MHDSLVRLGVAGSFFFFFAAMERERGGLQTWRVRALPLGGLRIASSALADIIGARRVRTAAKKRLRANGAWGPFKLERGAHYEFTISRSTSAHHLCFEPFQHDDDLISLLTADRTPDSTP